MRGCRGRQILSRLEPGQWNSGISHKVALGSGFLAQKEDDSQAITSGEAGGRADLGGRGLVWSHRSRRGCIVQFVGSRVLIEAAF